MARQSSEAAYLRLRLGLCGQPKHSLRDAPLCQTEYTASGRKVLLHNGRYAQARGQ